MQIVIDTNVLVSCLFRQSSRINRMLWYLIDGEYKLLYSEKTMRELNDVLRFRGVQVLPKTSINVCRDPNDNKFLEPAVDGPADYIVSGDKDLLALHPFRGISIVTPTEFLELFEKQ